MAKHKGGQVKKGLNRGAMGKTHTLRENIQAEKQKKYENET